MSPVVRVERLDAVLTISIERPGMRNAVNRAVAEQLAAAMRLLDSDPALRVGVLTGAGGTFCSGMDLDAFLAGELPVAGPGGFAGFVESPPRKPLVAAVEGYAVAGGFEMALAADVVVAAEDAQFGLPEVRRGLVAGGGGLLRLSRRIPRNEAMRLALTGAMLGASRAFELGLVSILTPHGEVRECAQRLAVEIAGNGPQAVLLSKQIIDASAGWPLDEQFVRQAELTEGVLDSAEAIEGARAFLERRPARWPSPPPPR